MAWVDSEQMWRMQTQKRTLSSMSNDSDDDSFSEPEDDNEGNRFLTTTMKKESRHVSPVKAARFDHKQLENMIICKEPPCNRKPRSFPDLSSYEQHHKQYHTLVCVECHLHFPTERILSLHLEERHDPFIEAKRAGKIYRYKCYVEGCGETFSGVVKRNTHLMMFHYYPANYFFGVVKFGVDKRDSMLTWENFQNSWGKTRELKVSERRNGKGWQKGEDMVVDEMGKTGGDIGNTEGDIGENGNKDSVVVGNKDSEMIGNDGSQMEIEMTHVEDPNLDNKDPMTVDKEGEQHIISNPSTVKRKLPIFAFQRKGIAVTRQQKRSQSFTPRHFNSQHSRQTPYQQHSTSQYRQ